jgi:ketol-acid reductoisomerase
MRVYYDRDADVDLIKSKKVAIVGYGSQGHAHALNLRDSGVGNIAIATREGSAAWKRAEKQGFEMMSTAEAARWADVLMILVPDESQEALFKEEIRDNIRKGSALAFAHGLSIHFRMIEPGPDTDVIMVAPKGPGHTVRSEYVRGRGIPCLVAVDRNPSGQALAVGLSYACALGGGQAGIIETTFRDECETDLFGEQAVLAGGLPALIMAGFDTLVEAGYPPEMAYFECLHEIKMNVDLLWEGGIPNMSYSISDTAEYGAYSRGTRVINEDVRRRMREILKEIQSGQFVEEWMAECKAGKSRFEAMRREYAQHPIEEIGARLRAMMPWITESRLVDESDD